MRFAIGLALAAFGPTGGTATLTNPAIASPASDEAAVRAADAAFWQAFNACDAEAMAKFFSDDVEFYHDITGLTRSRAAVTRSMMSGPCKSSTLHVRRELIAASVRYDAIPGYGAILAGEHLFLAREGDGPERPATRAGFMVVWHDQAGRWLMSRIVSYDHRPVPYVPSAQGIALPVEMLRTHVGRYRTAAAGDIVVTLEGGTLVLRSGDMRVTLAASGPDRFFARERDLQFLFTTAPAEVKVVENGSIVATGTRVPAPD